MEEENVQEENIQEENIQKENEEEEEESMEDVKPLLKPMFVSKDERMTVKEREKKQEEEEARLEAERKRIEELQIERKMMIIKAVPLFLNTP